MASHPFRFGVVTAAARTGEEWAERARRIESLGYATLLLPDNIEHTLASFPALAAAAAATRTLRVGTYVLANDLRNPVMVAKDAASLDLLSGGRFELGLGAGRPGAEAENRMLGMEFDSGGARVARLAESLAIIKPLLAGQRVNVTGTYYHAVDAAVSPLPVQQPLPILVAAGGKRSLSLAAPEVNIIALALPPNATEAQVLERVGWLREAAGAHFDDLELHMQLMVVGDRMPRWIAAQFGSNIAELIRSGAVPVVTGSVDEMCDQLLARRERLGVSYLAVSDELMEAFAPVVARLAGR